MRIERDELNMAIAGMIALRSQCNRRKVGAVATYEGRIIATGYNNRLGKNKCTHENCNEQNPCTGTVHAEQNLIAFSARNGVQLLGATLYCTDEPCLTCAQSIIQAGIKRVFYKNEYRTHDGFNLLMDNGVDVLKMEEPLRVITDYLKANHY